METSDLADRRDLQFPYLAKSLQTGHAWLLLPLILIPSECLSMSKALLVPDTNQKLVHLPRHHGCSETGSRRCIKDRMTHVHLQQGCNSTKPEVYTVTGTCLKWQQRANWLMITWDHDNNPYTCNSYECQTSDQHRNKGWQHQCASIRSVLNCLK